MNTHMPFDGRLPQHAIYPKSVKEHAANTSRTRAPTCDTSRPPCMVIFVIIISSSLRGRSWLHPLISRTLRSWLARLGPGIPRSLRLQHAAEAHHAFRGWRAMKHDGQQLTLTLPSHQLYHIARVPAPNSTRPTDNSSLGLTASSGESCRAHGIERRNFYRTISSGLASASTAHEEAMAPPVRITPHVKCDNIVELHWPYSLVRRKFPSARHGKTNFFQTRSYGQSSASTAHEETMAPPARITPHVKCDNMRALSSRIFPTGILVHLVSGNLLWSARHHCGAARQVRLQSLGEPGGTAVRLILRPGSCPIYGPAMKEPPMCSSARSDGTVLPLVAQRRRAKTIGRKVRKDGAPFRQDLLDWRPRSLRTRRQ